MSDYESIVTQPVFFLFVAFSFLLAYGYFWGRKRNHAIFASAFEDLLKVFRPSDQTFTNIGGAIGYHANLHIRKKGAFLSRVDATITMLPRHSWLYLPVSKLTRKYDRLFLELHLKAPPAEECHLIEAGYSGFAGTRITNSQQLQQEEVDWGGYRFRLYYQSPETRSNIMDFLSRSPEPGLIRHIAVVPGRKKCFIFMIPKRGQVADSLFPVYNWLPSLIKTMQRSV